MRDPPGYTESMASPSQRPSGMGASLVSSDEHSPEGYSIVNGLKIAIALSTCIQHWKANRSARQ